MIEGSQRSIGEMMADTSLIASAVRQGVCEAVLNHAHLGRPVPAWEDGVVVWASPEEVLARIANEVAPSPPEDRGSGKPPST
jgi:hypothetical protein